MKDVMLVKLLAVLYVRTPILLATVHLPLPCDLGGFWGVLFLVSSWLSLYPQHCPVLIFPVPVGMDWARGEGPLSFPLSLPASKSLMPL